MHASRHDKQQWHEIVAEFEVSGLSQRAFADQNRIKLGTFQSWLYKIRSAKESPKFVEVVATAKARSVTTPVRPAVAIAVGSARVEFEEPPTIEYLAALVRVLAAEPS